MRNSVKVQVVTSHRLIVSSNFLGCERDLGNRPCSSSRQGRSRIAHRFNGWLLSESTSEVPSGTKDSRRTGGHFLSPRWGFGV